MAIPTMFVQGASALAGALGNSGGGSRSMQLAAPSASELAGEAAVTQFLPQMGNLVNAGPGMNEVKANMGTQNDLANMLKSFSQGGFMPGQQDFAAANQFAQSAFQPQQVAINQQFQDEQLKANQMAARMGRSANDPLIQAKLSQERQRAQERLGASQSSYVSEFARSMPQQRLGYMGQLADLRSGLASQALSNRQALVSLGSQIEGQGRQFRLGSAQINQQQQQGGGLGGALTGLMAGIGATNGGGLMNLFGGGGSSGGSGSMLGTGNLNTAFGFGANNGSPVNFGASNMFGQLTGASVPGRMIRSAPAGMAGPVGTGLSMPAFSQASPAAMYNASGNLDAMLGGMGFGK